METLVTEKTIKIARSKKGLPCLWESLVNFSDLRRATIILDSNGESKQSLYWNNTREKQALVPIVEGDMIVKSFKDQHGIALSIFKIQSISNMSNEAVIYPIYRKSSQVDEIYPMEFTNVIHLVVDKLQGESVIVSKQPQ